MKTYWDYTPQERAELTEDQVNSLLDVELMTKGVKKPVPPVLVEIPKSPLGEKVKKFSVHYHGRYGSERADAVFNTLEQAQAFIDLCPSFQTFDYEVGSEMNYLKPMTESKIAAEEFYSIEQINAFRSELKNRKAKTEANEKAQADFIAACKKSEEITKGVWTDWHEWLNHKRELQQIVNTYAEYTALSGGDVNVALNFLTKTYTSEKVDEAREWFPSTFPVCTEQGALTT